MLLVLDASTGQNGLSPGPGVRRSRPGHGRGADEAGRHREGRHCVAGARELGVPVKLVGLGEGADDLAPFVPAAFVDALLD